MPEILTQHPDVTISVLRGAGVRCGEGAPQQILTACPRERFCSAPSGEICVFGLGDVHAMTQIRPSELVRAATTPAGTPLPDPETGLDPGVVGLVISVLLLGLILGVLVTRMVQRSAARRART
ncbi:MAG TPA: hypothetical protein VFL61_01820 [Gaiellaceae bacterium]|nr:hypothetical protein [Gaiellaceae bacterium]